MTRKLGHVAVLISSRSTEENRDQRELRLRPAGDTLQLVKQVGVGTTVSIREQVFGFAVFPALVDRIGEPGADLHGAGLMLLAPDRQGRSREVGVATAVCFVITYHAAEEKIQQESFLLIGVPVEQGDENIPIFVVTSGERCVFQVVMTHSLRWCRPGNSLAKSTHFPDGVL